MTQNSNEPNFTGKPHFLETKKFADGLFRSLAIVCALLVALDILYQSEHSHWHFEIEGYNGFHAIFGFLAYMAIVNTAKALRRFVKRDEDYYGE